MIFLSGSINLCTQQELQREAEFFSRNGWELKDPTTHRVSVTIAQEDIEAFCDYLRSKAPDRKPKVWRDRNGVEHQAPTVTFFLNGTEVTGTWTRLKARLDPQAQQRQAQPPLPARQSTPAPVRRSATPPQPPTYAQPAQPPATPDRPPVWQSEAFEDEEVPF